MNLSAALAENFCSGRPWRECRKKVMEAYKVHKPSRRERFAAVMAGLRDYRAEEFDGELLDLFATYRALGGLTSLGCDDFIAELRRSVAENSG